jgi:hypothetical protein
MARLSLSRRASPSRALLRIRLRLISLCALLAALALAACGTHGAAPTLGSPAQAVFVSASGGAHYTVTLTPINALRVQVFYRGSALPFANPATPAELRQGSCFGPLVAALTEGVPPAGATSASAPDLAGGADVAVTPSANLYVDVRARASDPHAPVTSCGHPLSGLRQYFDLFPPSNQDIAWGTALVDPTAATRLAVTSAAGTTPSVVGWAVNLGACSGATVGSGSGAGGVIFRPLDTAAWWVTITFSDGKTACGSLNTHAVAQAGNPA